MDNVVVIRGRLRCYSVEEAGVHQFLQEKLDVAELGVLDSEGFEHAQVSVLDCHEDGAEVFQVRSHQVQGSSEVFDGLGFWNVKRLAMKELKK